MGLEQFLAGKVCSDCNNGWMSALEQENRELLMGLIDQKIAPAELNESQRLLVAKWAVKTSIVCDSYIGDPPEIDKGLIRQFDKGRSDIIGRCGVFAGRLNIASRFGYIRRLHSNELILDSTKQDVGITIGLYIDGFVVITSFVDRDLGYTFEIVKSEHVPIWPNRGHEFKENPTLRFDGRGRDLVALIDAIGVRYQIQVKD